MDQKWRKYKALAGIILALGIIGSIMTMIDYESNSDAETLIKLTILLVGIVATLFTCAILWGIGEIMENQDYMIIKLSVLDHSIVLDRTSLDKVHTQTTPHPNEWLCPNCNTWNHETSVACRKCGSYKD